MTYILDANFFIEANRFHLPIEQHPAFWSWLANLAVNHTISIPHAVYEELMVGKDAISAWLEPIKEYLVNDTAAVTQISRVMAEGYGAIDEVTLEKLRADPWVIAQALAQGRTVVTSEKPGRHTAPHNKKISSVCQSLHVPCQTITAFLWDVRTQLPV